MFNMHETNMHYLANISQTIYRDRKEGERMSKRFKKRLTRFRNVLKGRLRRFAMHLRGELHVFVNSSVRTLTPIPNR